MKYGIFATMNERRTEDSFKAFFVDNLHNVKYYAYSYIKDEDLAENVAQEAFLVIWKRREELDFSSNLIPYLYTVVRNLALNVLRKKGYEGQYNEYGKKLTRDYLNCRALEDSAPGRLYAKEVDSIVRDTLAKLPEDVAKTFRMCKFDGFSYVRTAEKMEVSVKTVEMRMTKTLKALREALRDYLALLMVFLFF